MLRLVGIDPIHLRSYPHQLSGGMRQRAMIAMALLFTPDLVIMDEPTSALDVVAQRSLMVQIKELQRRLGFAVVFVTHDMSLVSHFSDRLLVMYAGQVVEVGADPGGLRPPGASVQPGAARRVPVDPRAAGAADRDPRQPARPAPTRRRGCRFQPRCPVAFDDCRDDRAGALPGRRGAGPLPAARAGQRSRGPSEEATSMTDVSVDADARPTRTAPLIEARGLTRHFKVGGAFSRKTLHAVDDADFTIGRREIVALVGESGSGKSTIARLLARVYKPTSGEILYQGRPLSAHAVAPADRWPTAATCRWCSRTRSARSTRPTASRTASCAA